MGALRLPSLSFLFRSKILHPPPPSPSSYPPPPAAADIKPHRPRQGGSVTSRSVGFNARYLYAVALLVTIWEAIQGIPLRIEVGSPDVTNRSWSKRHPQSQKFSKDSGAPWNVK